MVEASRAVTVEEDTIDVGIDVGISPDGTLNIWPVEEDDIIDPPWTIDLSEQFEEFIEMLENDDTWDDGDLTEKIPVFVAMLRKMADRIEQAAKERIAKCEPKP